MTSKSSSLALWGLAMVCAVLLAACSTSPVLQYVGISPTSATIYVSAPPSSAVKGAVKSSRRAFPRKAALSPRDITTATCGTTQFGATGFYSNGTSQALTTGINWTSSNSSVATVDNTGLATGIALGTTNIGASSILGVSAVAAALEVDQLNSITMNPTSGNITNGTTGFAFMALGNFTLASGASAQQDISSQVTWASTNMNVATVDTMGNITTVAPGTTTITATSCDGITVGMANLTVGAITTLQVSPGTGTIAAGTTLAFIAMEVPPGGSPGPLSNPVTWSSDTPSVATVDPTSGVALAIAPGTAHITATETVTGYTGPPAVLTVQAAVARYAYIANLNSPPFISMYNVTFGSSGGSLSQPTNVSLTTEAAAQVLIHPTGDLLYYIDQGCSLHLTYLDSTSGTLTLTSPVISTSSLISCIGVIEPYGRFIYVLSPNNNSIYGFAVTQPNAVNGKTAALPGTAGTLTAITGVSPYTDSTLNNFPDWIMIDRTGNYLYVVNNGFDGTTQHQGTISQYSISQTTGALTPLGTATINVGNGTTNGPFFGNIDVNNNLFVANLGQSTTDETVTAFSITASGANAGELTLLGDTPISGASATINVITSPVANNLYVLDAGPGGGQNGKVFAYSYTIADNAITLTQIGTTTPPTGANASGGMAIDPTGALLLVDDAGVNSTPPVDGSIFVYPLGTNGSLPSTPTNTPAGVGAQFITFYTALSGQ